MTENEWNAFSAFRDEFKCKVEEWCRFSEKLIPLVKNAAEKDTPPYEIENLVVYNSALDKITPEDDIKLIVIGDNPGKNEQLSANKAYLVGQSGKLADGFFKKNPELEIDFRKNVIILNKTPVHTAKTKHLKELSKNGGEEIQNLIEESQIWMAEKTAALLSELKNCSLWLVGYAELKSKGIFTLYRDALKSSCTSESWNRVFVFQHFSMNCFNRDINDFAKKNPSLSLNESLKRLGSIHKEEVFN